MDTVWVFGDQLNDRIASLEGVRPEATRILIVSSEAKLRSKVWHRQRIHLVLTAMRRFATHLRAAGFDVDERHAPSLAEGLAAHRRDLRPDRVRAMEPMSWDGLRLVERSDVEIVRSNQFLCHREDFARWADGRGSGPLVMEDFYRWRRQRLGYLMDGGRPAGGAWNFDASNREPPPRDARSWPPTPRGRLDAVDHGVLSELGPRDVRSRSRRDVGDLTTGGTAPTPAIHGRDPPALCWACRCTPTAVMATKPYAGGGAYINRRSDYCKGCAYDPKRRTGDDACPFTTSYWDFFARQRTRFAGNHRMAQGLHGLDRLPDLDDVRERATEVLGRLDDGTL
ncbi:MAG: hypothetical protein NVS3B21_05940 [Acidimicrobiales bacterium]